MSNFLCENVTSLFYDYQLWMESKNEILSEYRILDIRLKPMY